MEDSEHIKSMADIRRRLKALGFRNTYLADEFGTSRANVGNWLGTKIHGPLNKMPKSFAKFLAPKLGMRRWIVILEISLKEAGGRYVRFHIG